MLLNVFIFKNFFRLGNSRFFDFLSVLGPLVVELAEGIACEVDVWVLVCEVPLLHVPLMKSTIVELLLNNLVHFLNNQVICNWPAVADVSSRRPAPFRTDGSIVAFEETP